MNAKKNDSDKKRASQATITGLFRTMFARQKNFCTACDAKNISKGNSGSESSCVHLLCFGFENPRCSVRKYRISKNSNKICRSLSAWRKEKRLSAAQANIAEYINNADTDEELLDFMIELAYERDKIIAEYDPREAKEDMRRNNQVHADDKNL